MGEIPGTFAARRRKLFVLVDEIGLTPEERMAFASTLLWRDITSWQQLDADQVNRLLDALEGHLLIEELKRQRL